MHLAEANLDSWSHRELKYARGVSRSNEDCVLTCSLVPSDSREHFHGFSSSRCRNSTFVWPFPEAENGGIARLSADDPFSQTVLTLPEQPVPHSHHIKFVRKVADEAGEVSYDNCCWRAVVVTRQTGSGHSQVRFRWGLSGVLPSGTH